LLLIYDDQRARLWDTKTKQLWRSMGREKAEELITQGRWSDLYERDTCLPETFWAPVADSFGGPDAGTIFLFFILAQN
jgi:WD repeat-containing protein 7